MKKLILFFLIPLITIHFVSCEGGSNSPDDDHWLPFYKALSDTKGLEIIAASNSFLNQTASDWEELTSCVGIKNNKLWIGLFRPDGERYTSVYTWTDTEEIERSMEFDFGFGDKKMCDFGTANIIPFEKSGIKLANGNVFVCLKLYYTNGVEIYEFIKITPDGRAEILLETPVEEYRLWFEDSFLVNTQSLLYAYDYDGVKLFESGISFMESGVNYLNDLEPVSIEQGILIRNYFNEYATIRRTDLTSMEILWERLYDFDFESQVRLDSWELTKKDGNDWYYTFDFTLYSGEKVTRELFVDIDTGEITYL